MYLQYILQGLSFWWIERPTLLAKLRVPTSSSYRIATCELNSRCFVEEFMSKFKKADWFWPSSWGTGWFSWMVLGWSFDARLLSSILDQNSQILFQRNFPVTVLPKKPTAQNLISCHCFGKFQSIYLNTLKSTNSKCQFFPGFFSEKSSIFATHPRWEPSPPSQTGHEWRLWSWCGSELPGCGQPNYHVEGWDSWRFWSKSNMTGENEHPTIFMSRCYISSYKMGNFPMSC